MKFTVISARKLQFDDYLQHLKGEAAKKKKNYPLYCSSETYNIYVYFLFSDKLDIKLIKKYCDKYLRQTFDFKSNCKT